MSPSRLLTLMMALGLLSFGLPACGGEAGDGDPTGDDDDAADDDDDAADDDDDDSSPPRYSINAVVVNDAGQPLSGLGVTACSSGTCLMASTNEAGELSIANLPGDDAYVIHNIGYPDKDPVVGAQSFSSFYDIVRIADEDVHLAEPLVVPSVQHSETVPAMMPAEMNIGDIRVAWEGEVSWPGSVAAASSHVLGYAQLPVEQAPTVLGNRTIFGVWSFAPFDTMLSGEEHPTFSVRLPFEDVSTDSSDTAEVSWHIAHYDEDIVTEVLGEVDAAYEVEGNIKYATVDVPVLSMIVAAGPEAPMGDDDDSAGDDDDSAGDDDDSAGN